MDELSKIHHLYKLKQVHRHNMAGDRSESAADHTWSSMILAEYFFPKIDVPLDKERVRQLILFHDLVEIESGDTFVLNDRADQTSKERAAFNVLLMRMPSSLADQYEELFEEYEARETVEAKFAWAIDMLDPMIDGLDHKEEVWRKHKFTEEKIRRHKEEYVKEFAVLHAFFEEMIIYLRENGYFTPDDQGDAGSKV